MLRVTLPSTTRITRTHKIAAATLIAAGATTAIAATQTPSHAQTTTAAQAPTTTAVATHAPTAIKPVATNGLPTKPHPAEHTKHVKHVTKHAKHKAATHKHTSTQAANRSTHRKTITTHYTNNLDGWIKHSLAIMKAKGIPGTYEGLHRNIMRESSGNPNAVNDWDINAINGVPSKGLLQVIQPTFDTYHVAGTANKLTDPVANLTAAANYAAHRYGSIDNVNSAY
ncbi:transglycosylase SLT domain-containing protein [Streptomyces sp. NBC_00344]|uniref:transglycosylase SLT domain-containing protein n=1 Tax=Streptomyces sp. NBC_00344 TaxID=2975720 RepID=UPI002E243375